MANDAASHTESMPPGQSTAPASQHLVEQPQAEAPLANYDALREREAQQQGLLKRLRVGLAVHGADGALEFSNDEASRLLGLSREQLQGKALTDLDWRLLRDDESTMPVSEYPVARMLASGQPLEDYVVGVDRPAPAGRVWALVRGYPEFGPRHELQRVVVTFDDITARRNSEQALRRSELLLKTLLEQSPIATALVTLDGTIEYLNRRAIETFGYQLADTPTMARWWALTCPDAAYRAEVVAQWAGLVQQAAASNNEVTRREYRARCKDGTDKTTVVFGVVVASKLFVMFEDITERKRAEEDAQHTMEALLNATGEIAKVGGWRLDLRSQSLFWTHQVYRIHDVDEGFKPTVTGAIDFYAPEARPVIADAVQRAIDHGEPFDHELQVITAKGARRWVRAIGRAVQQAGKTVEVLGTFQDISERKRTEELIEHSERRLQETAKIGKVGGWEVDVRTGQQKWTEETFRIHEVELGYQPTVERGVAFYTPSSRPLIERAVARAIEHGEPFDLELEIITARGNHRSVNAIGRADAARHRVYGFFQDITERVRLRAGMAQADRLSSMGMLAAGVSHEINNPLTYVLAHLEELAQQMPRVAGFVRRCSTALNERAGEAALAQSAGPDANLLDRGALEALVASAQGALEGTLRIRKISRALSTFSRVEQVERSGTDLNLAAETAATMAHNEVKYRATLVKALSPVPPVLGTEGKLSQVFLNLIINAAHAIGDGHADQHRITLRTWANGDDVFAAVEDTGPGIPPENLERIFEPFFTTKKVGAGSGLGLSISRNIVTEFGGDLRVESEPGKGARFVVRLPAHALKAAAPQVPPALPQRPSVRGRILVVDDEVPIRNLFGRIFGQKHEVLTAASGREAQQLLEKDTAFDLILCDLMMPEMTGMELHAWLMVQAPALAARLVFMSGGAFTQGAVDYLARANVRRIDKPFDLPELQRVVASLVEEVVLKRAARPA